MQHESFIYLGRDHYFFNPTELKIDCDHDFHLRKVCRLGNYFDLFVAFISLLRELEDPLSLFR
jgi:hypothetical protein